MYYYLYLPRSNSKGCTKAHKGLLRQPHFIFVRSSSEGVQIAQNSHNENTFIYMRGAKIYYGALHLNILLLNFSIHIVGALHLNFIANFAQRVTWNFSFVLFNIVINYRCRAQ